MGMDTLKLQQLSSLLTQMGEGAAEYNPVQKTQLTGLTGSAQSSITAEAQKKAQKEAKKRKGSLSKTLTGAAKGGMQGFMLGGPWGAVAGAGAGAVGGATGYDQEVGAIGDTATMGKNMGMFGGGDKAVPLPDATIDKAAMATETPAPPVVTQGTPDPGYYTPGTMQVKSLPKPDPASLAPPLATTAPAAPTQMNAPPAMAKSTGGMPDFSSMDFSLPAAAVAGLATYGLASADNRQTRMPMNVTPIGTPAANVRAGGVRGTPPQMPTQPVTVEEAKQLGFKDPMQIEMLRKQGLIKGADPKDIALAGLVAAGAGLMAGGKKNA